MPDSGGVSLGTARGVVSIEAQLDQAASQVAAFSQQTTQQMAAVSASTNQAQNAFTALGAALGVSLSLQGLERIVQITAGLATAAAQADHTAAAFDDLAASVGDDGDQMLAAMQKTSDGMVSDANLIADANKAMLLGVTTSSAQMAQLLEIARARAGAMGISTAEAFDAIVTGIGRMSPRILDNLGIVVGGEKAFSDYAESIGRTADSLTDAEKKAFLLNRTLKDSSQLIQDQANRGKDAQQSYEKAATAWSNYLHTLGTGINVIATSSGLVDASTAALNTQTNVLQTGIGFLQKYIDKIQEAGRAFDKSGLGQALGGNAPTAPGMNVPSATNFGTGAPPIPSAPLIPQIQLDQQTAISDWWTKRQQIETDMGQALNDETDRYEKQRADSERNYQEQVTESAASFAKQRMRAQEDYERSILDIMRAAQERDARMASDHAAQIERMQSDSAQRIGKLDADLDRTIAQQRADSADKIAGWQDDHDKQIEQDRLDSAGRLLQIEQDYNDQRAQALLQHQDTLGDAAARNDANAVFEENRNFARSQAEAQKNENKKVDDEKDKLQKAIDNVNESYAQKLDDEQKALDKSIKQAQDAHDRQVKDEQDALQQRIDDANAAYTQQLADAKAADAQRITDMAAHFEEEKTRGNEDQVERMTQMGNHHTEEMTAFDTEHGNRITQISTHAGKEREQLDTEHQKQMKQLGDSNREWDKVVADHDKEALRQHKLFYDQENKAFLEAQIIQMTAQMLQPGADIGTLSKAIETFNTLLENANNDIDSLNKQAPAVASASGVVAASSFVGQGFSRTLPASAQTTSMGGVSMGDVTVVIGDIGNRSNSDVKQLVGDALLEWLNRVAQYGGSGR